MAVLRALLPGNVWQRALLHIIFEQRSWQRSRFTLGKGVSPFYCEKRPDSLFHENSTIKLAFTMRAWPVARSILEKSERADNRLDKISIDGQFASHIFSVIHAWAPGEWRLKIQALLGSARPSRRFAFLALVVNN